MVIVVPSLARSDDGDEHIVSAVVVGFVVSITPEVVLMVSPDPCCVPHHDWGKRAAPEKKLLPKKKWLGNGSATGKRCSEA